MGLANYRTGLVMWKIILRAWKDGRMLSIV